MSKSKYVLQSFDIAILWQKTLSILANQDRTTKVFCLIMGYLLSIPQAYLTPLNPCFKLFNFLEFILPVLMQDDLFYCTSYWQNRDWWRKFAAGAKIDQ